MPLASVSPRRRSPDASSPRRQNAGATSPRRLNADAIAQNIQREVERSLQRVSSMAAVVVDASMQTPRVAVDPSISALLLQTPRAGSVAPQRAYSNATNEVRRAVTGTPYTKKTGLERDISAVLAELTTAGSATLPIATPRLRAQSEAQVVAAAAAERSLQRAISAATVEIYASLQTPRSSSVSCLHTYEMAHMQTGGSATLPIAGPQRLTTGPAPYSYETEILLTERSMQRAASKSVSVLPTYAPAGVSENKFTVAGFAAVGAQPTPSTTCSSLRSARGDATIGAISTALSITRAPHPDVRYAHMNAAPRSPASMYRHLNNQHVQPLITPRPHNNGMLSARGCQPSMTTRIAPQYVGH